MMFAVSRNSHLGYILSCIWFFRVPELQEGKSHLIRDRILPAPRRAWWVNLGEGGTIAGRQPEVLREQQPIMFRTGFRECDPPHSARRTEFQFTASLLQLSVLFFFVDVRLHDLLP